MIDSVISTCAIEVRNDIGNWIEDFRLSSAIILFAKEMQIDISKFSDVYKTNSYSYLFKRLKEELEELEIALIDSHHELVVSQAAKVATFAMFISLNSTRIANHEQEK